VGAANASGVALAIITRLYPATTDTFARFGQQCGGAFRLALQAGVLLQELFELGGIAGKDHHPAVGGGGGQSA
jgi:hypothetical protein